MSLMLLSPPLGIISGYIMTAWLINHVRWEISFYIQGVIMILCFILTLFVPHIYCEIDLV